MNSKENSEEISKEPQPITTEHFALEVLKEEQRKSKALIIGLTIGLIISGITSVTTIVCSKAEREELVQTNYQNDKEWRSLFDSYDFISQDGEGFNNVNSGTQGNLDNSDAE